MELIGLNSAQKDAVEKTDGAIMILAGAGSGKTRTLVTRIAYLLEQKNVSSFQMLALTFSNKAAREMRDRVSREINIDPGELRITTFHSFCAQVLRSEAQYLGLSRNFTIYDESESKAVVTSLIKKNGLTTKQLSPYEVLNYISGIKNNGDYISVKDNSTAVFGEIDLNDEYYPYFCNYERELHLSNALDFGGLITAVIQLFESFPKVLEVYQNRFRYVLVDEYQDTNRAQFRLLKMLCSKHRNICVVGDEDQSIYSWRGADIRNILDFEKVFPEVEVLKLEQNYRSSKNIIEAASCVIEKNEMRKGKSMWTDNPEGESIQIIECYNDKKEGEFLAGEIMKLEGEGVLHKDMAIFYRTNSQSRLIEDCLRKNRIPYRVVGGVEFYNRKEIKDMICYLRVVVNEKDSLALGRIVNVPTRGIGVTSLRKLETEAQTMGISLWELIDALVESPEKYSHIKFTSKVKRGLGDFSKLINEVKRMDKAQVSPSILYEKILHESGYYQHLKARKDYESLARLENLDELTSAIKQFEEEGATNGISGFLQTISLDTSREDSDEAHVKRPGNDSSEVSLMTIHGAKGLEFPYVFLAGAEENVFPSYRSLGDGEVGVEEERRLFYVAMTRAMKRLYIAFAKGRMLFGQLKFNGPSRFIHEIPDRYYLWKKRGQGHNRNPFGGEEDWDSDRGFSSNHVEDTPVIYQVDEKRIVRSKYAKGSGISHSLYGKGTVLSSEGSGDNEKVTIRFFDGTRKKFMVKFAPLNLL